MQKKVLSDEQKRAEADLTIIGISTLVPLVIYMGFNAQISALLENTAVHILLRTLVLALLQFGTAGLGITIVSLIRKESFTSHGLVKKNLPKTILLSILGLAPYLAFRAVSGTLTSWSPFQTVFQMKELLASSLPTKVLGIAMTAVSWGFFEGFNYAVVSDKINTRYPPKNLWMNPGAIACGILCLLVHGLIGVTPDALIEAVAVFSIIYGMLVVKTYTGNAWGTAFLFLFVWNAIR